MIYVLTHLSCAPFKGIFVYNKLYTILAEGFKIISPHEGFQERFVRTNVDFAVGGGVLNPQPLDSLVSTPYGFKRIGDIEVGDVISDANGGVQRVLFVIDKGMQPCVEFTLQDGRKVQSALSHHWKVKERHGNVLDISASEIVNHIDKAKKRDKRHTDRLRIPIAQPVKFNKNSKLRIHPYLLGCLLGDGCLSKKLHRADLAADITSKEIIDRLVSLGYDVVKESKNEKSLHYCIRNKEVVDLLEELGLWGKLCYDKFIPDEYKYAPIEDRLELIKGLFDTDGYCSKPDNGRSSRCGYRTKSKRLAKDIQEVIWSIGGRCIIHTTPKCVRIQNGKEKNCAESYGLLVWTKNDKDLFHLSRKKDKAIDEKSRKCSTTLSIIDYKLIGEKEVRCINVSGDEHLYLTDGYVVTRNCGKTFAAVLSVAEPSSDGRFRGLFLRNNLGDAKAAGGILDTFKEVYGNDVEVVESGDPRVTFKNTGAKIDVTHVADQSREKVLQRFKGRQYDFIYFDEGTGFTWDCFTAIYTRNRGTSSWTGKVRMTTNPDRNHWLRTFLDWYIGIDGYIREDREGVVRYFYINGETPKDVVWGDTKYEVYQKCKVQIDRTLAKVNGRYGKATYQDIIKSFTFYLGRMSENKTSIENNKGYVGAVAISGGRNAEQLLEGNWNVSPEDAIDACISSTEANEIFTNDPQTNGDKWVTCDLADFGTDNFVALSWNGFHVTDVLVLNRTTPRENAERLIIFAAEHDVVDDHIIYDATGGRYISDYIPDARPFISNHRTMGMYGRMFMKLKDECYARLVEMVKRKNISIDESVANKTYEHQELRTTITIQNELIEELQVVMFKSGYNGKKTLYTKKEMNAKLGLNRSMDMADPLAMRMMPVLEYPYGEELERTTLLGMDEEYDEEYIFGTESVFEKSAWY